LIIFDLSIGICGKIMENKLCYVCSSNKISLKLVESPIERRFDMPVLPSENYQQSQCADCGLLFVTCNVSEEYLNKLYASESVNWQKDFLNTNDSVGSARMAEFRYLAKLMLAYVDASFPKEKKMLDFGCQTGEFAKIVLDMGKVKPFGVEMSQDYANHAMSLWGEGEVHVGSLKEIPFSKKSFDFISAQEVLEHLVNPLETLQLLRGLIKDKGIILISVPSSDYFILKKRVFSFFKRPGHALIHTHLYNFTPKSLKIMLQKASFEPISTFGIGWHDFAEKPGNLASTLINKLTLGSKVFSPSVVVLARAI
jgi:2-polyprenyl-3-methyl-5-hydroxy-6-metoxy-1,4-benzoquinol methylase